MSTNVNPSTGETFKAYPPYSPEVVLKIIEQTQLAQTIWQQEPLAHRAKMMTEVGRLLLKKKEELARICTLEMGKPLKESVAEIEKCASACSFFAENAQSFLCDEVIKTEAQLSYVTYRPLGIVLAIMPWNYPYWQVIRFAIPALCAGNAALLKHASNVPGCSLALEEIFKEAGLPANLFRSLIIPAQNVASIIEHKSIKAVTLTGSTSAGKKVASTAGAVLKKVVLELGGSDAYIILEDADLDLAAGLLVRGRLLNAGQSCISPKRLIVLKEVYEPFKEKVLLEIQKVTFGDPFDSEVQMGPMARRDLRDELHRQVKKSVDQGAVCLHGGKIPEGVGAFYPPTLLVEVLPGMPAFDEELFGPVVCLIAARDEAHAIELANKTEYGLGGGIFSKNMNRAKKIAENDIESGGVFINDFLKSDPRLPFGGIKESGHGRELSYLGIREFVNAKTIYLK